MISNWSLTQADWAWADAEVTRRTREIANFRIVDCMAKL
jgi:hypothetical protein